MKIPGIKAGYETDGEDKDEENGYMLKSDSMSGIGKNQCSSAVCEK